MIKNEIIFKLTITTNCQDWEWEKDKNKELDEKIEKIYELIEELNGDSEFEFSADFQKVCEL